MTRRAKIFSVIAMLTIGLGFAATTYAKGEPFLKQRGQGIFLNQEKYQAVNDALEKGDYETWKKAVTEAARPPLLDQVTPENFKDFAAMHTAMQKGDYKTAQELRTKLGFGPGSLKGGGFGCGFGKGKGRGFGMMQGFFGKGSGSTNTANPVPSTPQ